MVREIEPTCGGANEGSENISDQRVDNGSECRADNYANGEVNNISAQRELFEFLDHEPLPCVSSAVMAALVAAIHVFDSTEASRGWPEQVRP